MMANGNIDDPWAKTISLLSRLSAGTKAGDILPKIARARQVVEAEHRDVVVNLIDRQSSSTVTISWRDPTRGCYGDQVWCASRARIAGICAMSGHPIYPGDQVYRPRASRRAPQNATAMILTSVLEHAQAA